MYLNECPLERANLGLATNWDAVFTGGSSDLSVEDEDWWSEGLVAWELAGLVAFKVLGLDWTGEFVAAVFFFNGALEAEVGGFRA